MLPKFLTNFQYFNPHSHEGSDTTPGVKDSKLAKFQSTLPRRERLASKRQQAFVQSFQSTLPRRERPCGGCNINLCKCISIHTPTKGATYIIFMEDITQQISIHTPTKGATAILTNNFLIFCSISLINFILYLQIIQILFIFRYKFIFYFIF